VRCKNPRWNVDFRFRFISSILLLSVMAFSLSSALHRLWHREVRFSLYTPRWCMNERAINHGCSLQEPLHGKVSFECHHFNCPVCSGMLDLAETAQTQSALFTAAEARDPSALAVFHRFDSDIKLADGRAPPQYSC